MSIKLDKAKVKMSAYWKFNSSLSDEKDFQDQLEIMVKRELTDAIIRNGLWAKLKDRIKSFPADYSRRLTLSRLVI